MTCSSLEITYAIGSVILAIPLAAMVLALAWGLYRMAEGLR